MYRQDNQYRAYTTDNIGHAQKGTEYYEYTLRLPDEEVVRIEKQDEVVDHKLITGNQN